MSVLHAYFHRRDQQAFQRAIDASIRALSSAAEFKPSSSLGKSLSTSPHMAYASSSSLYVDVNARDNLGRTVLHLACSSTHPSAPTYVRLLLSHPHIQPNIYDQESHWTALHRAMYYGNLASALLLLQRGDVDVYAKDWEGYAAYDVWNSSIEGTKPERTAKREIGEDDVDETEAELYVWGSNRNAGLGLGDGDDRAFPDLVQFGRDRDKELSKRVDERFKAVRVRGVAMARFHTSIVTTEPQSNVRVCGFGSGGRLGPGIHTTTYTPIPLTSLPSSSSFTSLLAYSPSHHSAYSHSLPHPRADWKASKSSTTTDPHRITAVAAGQDHTLVLTAGGDVWSWGNNRHAVLGYVIEPSTDADVFTVESDKRSDTRKAGESKKLSGVEKGGEAGAVQSTPRKVQGGLKGRRVRAIAACRTASACVTEDGEVLTWGVNSGQLGYDRTAHPVQVLPRVVTKVSQPVLEVTITDTATVLLLSSHDALCLWNDTSFRLTFPSHSFPSAIAAYRPPQAVRNASIDRVVATEFAASNSANGRESAMFAALSANGELFTWVIGALDNAGGAGGGKEKERREVVKPQRVWALRKKFSAVKDVALGADGSILVCTESGHVFLRARATTSGPASGSTDLTESSGAGAGKAFKFQRVPYLQRIVKVYANSTGAYAALRVDASAVDVKVEGKVLKEELEDVVPWRGNMTEEEKTGANVIETWVEDDAEVEMKDAEDDVHDVSIAQEHVELKRLLALLEQHAQARKASTSSPLNGEPPRIHGADLLVHILGGTEPKIPAHRVILAARSKVLRDVLSGQRTVEAKLSNGTTTIRFSLAKDKFAAHPSSAMPHPAPWTHPARLTISGAHPLSILILLTYLYTDTLIAIWDWRVASSPALKAPFEKLKVKPGLVKAELQAMASVLGLAEMERAMEGAFKRDLKRTVDVHFGAVFQEVCLEDLEKVVLKDPLRPDVVLKLEDREVRCHSVVLRARSPLFKAFFDEEVWTVNRWTEEAIVRVDLSHLGWRAMRFVVRYLYGGESEMFEVLDDVNTVDELLEFMFSVMSAANELLLDRLVLLCSSVIQRRINVSNACSILSDATYFNAVPLVRSVLGYMARNLETLLESRMLDDLPADLIKQFSVFVREEQQRKAPFSRSTKLVDEAMAKNKEWLELQDFPQPIVRSAVARPSSVGRKRSVGNSPAATPAMRPLTSCKPTPVMSIQDAADDGVFMMDNVDPIPPLSLSQPRVAKTPSTSSLDVAQKGSTGWKVPSSAPKVDMKSIMAEAETTKAGTSRPPTLAAAAAPRQPPASDTPNWRTPQRKPSSLPTEPAERSARPAVGSPWKTIPSVPSLVNLVPSAGHSPIPTPPMTPQMRATRPRDEVLHSGASSKSQPLTPQRPGMGPVFAPAKQSPAKTPVSTGMNRVPSNTAAWTLPPVQPVVQSSTSTSGMSFVAIQELQREQENTTPKKDRRSLKEIQEEEQARQVEDDFLRWWAAEEERMRSEQMPVQSPSPSLRRPRGKKSAAKGGADGVVRDSGKEAVKEGPKKDGRKREGGKDKDGGEGASNAPRRRRRPGPTSTPKPDVQVDG